MAAATLHVCTTCRRAETIGGALPGCAGCPLNVGATDTFPACGGCKVTADGTVERVRPGALMLGQLLAADLPPDIDVVGVECLSACTQGCAVALSAPGKWTYVYGRMDPDRDAPAILAGATAYAASADGIVPWRERPEVFRKQSLARVPPLK